MSLYGTPNLSQGLGGTAVTSQAQWTQNTPSSIPINTSVPNMSSSQPSMSSSDGMNSTTSLPPPSLLPPPPISTSSPSLPPPLSNSSVPSEEIKNSKEGSSQENSSGSSCNSSKEGGFPSKIVLRVKKNMFKDEEGQWESFEKQEISKNDSYCWVCHEGGEVLCCDQCPRVFHLQCSGLTVAPDDDEEWICPVCKNIARKPKRSRPHNLNELLRLAITRMMFPGTEIFQRDIPDDIIGHYKEYVFHPMHLGMIKEKVTQGYYHSTREFLHQTEWILHNCIIYNGGKHALTKIAKGIVKVCKEDMREIELCPSCYGLTVKQPADWFCIPCNPPHKVVLAKVRGYPLWPAKLISVTTDKCDVRFFGQHDRSLVPRSSIQVLNGPPPTPTTKTAHWVLAMEELTKYRQNIDLMLQHIDAKKTPEEFIAKLMAEPPKPQPAKEPIVKVPRGAPKKEKIDKLPTPSSQTRSVSPSPSASHNGYSNERGESDSRESSVVPSFTVSNHIPCSPQIVMVNPPISESEEAGTIHGNSASFPKHTDSCETYSEPSSPESDTGGLTIDLDGSQGSGGGGEEKGGGGGKRIAQSGNKSIMKGPKKTSKIAPEAYINSKYGPAMDVQMITPPSSYQRSSNQSKPGDALSFITHNLAEKRAMEIQARNGSIVPNSDSNNGGGEEEMETAFSSIYPPGKRAIAVVDPNAKRKRKKGAAETSPSKATRRGLRNKKNESTIPCYTYEGTPSLITGYDTSNNGLGGGGGTHYDNSEETLIHYGEGLLADTMRTIDQSYNARLDGMVGSAGDMGYQYFSEKLMSSIKTVVIEMLAIFESKGKAGAKQIKDHLHTAWPVPDSRSQLEKLKSELKDEMKKSLQVVRASADLERQQVIAEVKAQAEAEKQLAIQETKKKKWCSYCLKEAQYNCCWNANYCNEVCQKAHWPEHMGQCTQVQATNSAGLVPRTPADIQKMLSPPQGGGGEGGGMIFNFNETLPEETPVEINRISSLRQSFDYPSRSPVETPPHMVATVTTVPPEETMLSIERDKMVTIEQIINHSAMLVHPTSPLQQSIMISQPPPTHLGLAPPTSPTHALRLINAHTNHIHGVPLHPPPPLSPPTHHHHHHQSVDSTATAALHNTFSWPYQQPIAGMSHDLSHALPLLPQVPAHTPTTQPSSFFRAF